jgi:acetyltransferase-like isoleucine patch superfamily enzyme
MRDLFAMAKACARVYFLRRKFPLSVIYSNVAVDNYSILNHNSVLFKEVTLINSSLGAYSYIQSGSVVSNAEIGQFCSIASQVNIGLANHPMHMVSSSPVFYDNSQPLPKFLIDKRVYTETLPRTIIGPDVWIGQGALVKAGVNIGVGAVIGAGSVVTKDIAPYTIAAGNPCKPIRLRFTEDIVTRLVESEWWMLSEQKLEELAPLFVDPVELLGVLEQLK